MEKIKSKLSLYELIEEITESRESQSDKSALQQLQQLQGDLSLCNNSDNFVTCSVTSTLQERYSDQLPKQNHSAAGGHVPDPLNLDPDFSRAGLIVKLHSDLLNEDFYLCSTSKLRDMAMKHDPGVVAYLLDEIECLAGLRSEEVRRLHMVKKFFPGGEFIRVVNVEDSIFNRGRE